MSGLTEIASAFKIASNSFDSIPLNENDDDLQRLNEVIAATALSVTLTGTGSGTANGVFLTEEV